MKTILLFSFYTFSDHFSDFKQRTGYKKKSILTPWSHFCYFSVIFFVENEQKGAK